MTREQIEVILKTTGAKADKEGATTFDNGANVTIHVAHNGATISLAKIEKLRFEGELLFASSAKQSVAVVVTDIFAVAVEGAGGQPARRPAGFL